MRPLFLRFIVLVACLDAHAFGDIIVWQTAEPLTSNSYRDQQGFGSRLDLRCDVTAGPCQWRVTTQLFIQDGSLGHYFLSVRDPAGSGTILSVSQTSTAGSPFSHVTQQQENHGGGYLSTIHAYVPTPNELYASPTVHFMHSYVLSEAATPAILGTMTFLRAENHIFGGSDNPGHQGDPYRYVQMAANPTIQFGEWPNPVIRINHVPEPGSLALLIPGGLMLRRPTLVHRRP